MFIPTPSSTHLSQKLNEFTRVPEYIAYLAYILAFMPQQEDRIRTIAGYLLKNNARLIVRAAPEVVAYVKASVLQAFFDPSMMVRNAAGQDIVSFLGILEPKNWPECLQQLVHTLDSSSLDQQEVRSHIPLSRNSVPRNLRHGATERLDSYSCLVYGPCASSLQLWHDHAQVEYIMTE